MISCCYFCYFRMSGLKPLRVKIFHPELKISWKNSVLVVTFEV